MYTQMNWTRYCIKRLNESNWYKIAVVVCHVGSSYKPCAIKIHTTRSTGYIIFPVILKYDGIGDVNKVCNANDWYKKKERVICRQDTLTNRYRWCISRKCYDVLVDKMICYVQEIYINTCTTDKKFHLYQNIYCMYHLEAVKETAVSLSKLAPMSLFSTGNKILKQSAKLSNSNEEYFTNRGWNKSCIGKHVFIFCLTVMHVFVHRLFGIYSLSRGKISILWLNICTHEKHWF